MSIQQSVQAYLTHLCQTASQVSPKVWQYKLISHDDVHKGDSFAAVISRAVKL